MQASKFTTYHREALERIQRLKKGITSTSVSSDLGWEKVTLSQEKRSCLLVFGTLRVWLCPIKERGSRVNYSTTKSTGTGIPEARVQCEAVEFLCKIKILQNSHFSPNPEFLCFIILTRAFVLHTHINLCSVSNGYDGLEPIPKM